MNTNEIQSLDFFSSKEIEEATELLISTSDDAQRPEAVALVRKLFNTIDHLKVRVETLEGREEAVALREAPLFVRKARLI